jgi:hypothetical protein
MVYPLPGSDNVRGGAIQDVIIQELFPQDMLGYDFIRHGSIYLAVNDSRHTGNNHFHGGLRMAQAHTAGLPDQYLFYELVVIQGPEKSVQSNFGAGSDTAGTHTYDNLNFFTLRIPSAQVRFLGIPQFPQFFQRHLCHISSLLYG